MATAASNHDIHQLHFSLAHLEQDRGFELRAGVRRYALRPHTDATRRAHAAGNAALARLAPEVLGLITHYAEDVELPNRSAMILRVVSPGVGDPAALPPLAALALHVPRAARLAHRQSKIAQGALHFALFDFLGIDQPGSGDLLRLSLDADDILTPAETATTLVFQHPQLATVNPTTASVIVDDHIRAAANSMRLSRFGAAIRDQGTTWSGTVYSTDYLGNVLTWGPNFPKSGQPVETYQLSSITLTAAGAPLALPLSTSQDDARLRNASWSSQQGIGSVSQDLSLSHVAARLARRPRAHAIGLGDPSSDFTLDNLTPGYGLDVDDSSLVFTPDPSIQGGGTVSINVKNSYLRSLWAYVRFTDADTGTVGSWQSVGLVSPVNVVLGIPVSTDPTTLSFTWDPKAKSATLAHGGLGTSRWDNDIVWPGIGLTGVFNYGIPSLFLVAGAALDSNAALKEIQKTKPIQVAVLKATTALCGNVGSGSICFPNVKSILATFGSAIAGLLVHAGLQRLQVYVAQQMTEGGMEEAIPFANIFFAIANRAIDLAELAETTVQVLLSPAVYSVDVTRAMPLQVTVSPDPTHGSLGNAAIWPLDSDHYQCIITYRGGTSYTATGPMLGANTSTPVALTYPSIPEGGHLQAQFSVYSGNNMLLGRWTSAWVIALRPQPGTVLALAGAIQEVLVPLTATTIYNYKEKLIYDPAAAAHRWQPNEFAMDTSVTASLDLGQASSAIGSYFQQNAFYLSSAAQVSVVTTGKAWHIADGGREFLLNFNSNREVIVNSNNIPLAVLPLNQNDVGNNLGATIDLTINDRAYMLGYCWMASGQNVCAAGTTAPVITGQINTFQNINVLAAPEAALKFSGVGFSNQPFIVYDQFGPVPLFSVPATFSSELDAGTISAELSALFAQRMYALPSSGIVVRAVTPSVEWTISINSIATYALVGGGGQIAVHPYPAVIISPNNFYLEPTGSDPVNYTYQVRRIVLDDATPFDMHQTQSWGQFLLPHLSDVAVHPRGYLVGAHANLDKLEILQLPAAATADIDAQPAVYIGGTGSRPGLFSQPVAVTATADGRILVLEQGNVRIQALDVSGNPVACFAGPSLPALPASFGAELDRGLVSPKLRDAFKSAGQALSAVWRIQDGEVIYQAAVNAPEALSITTDGDAINGSWTVTAGGLSPQIFQLVLSATQVSVRRDGTTLFAADPSVAASLDRGGPGIELAEAFKANGITLVNPVTAAGTSPLQLHISALEDLAQGNIPASLASGLAALNITLSSATSVTASVAVKTVQSGKHWTLTDNTNGTTFEIKSSSTGELSITQLLPTMALNPPPARQTLTYLGVASEAKGYIYVLNYVQPGGNVSNFILDIYNPDGTALTSMRGVNAGDIAVDMWRNVYTLNYESVLGPAGRTEPSVSIWTPST
jgi:hypothetical protein